jgi:hypothetical protein
MGLLVRDLLVVERLLLVHGLGLLMRRRLLRERLLRLLVLQGRLGDGRVVHAVVVLGHFDVHWKEVTRSGAGANKGVGLGEKWIQQRGATPRAGRAARMGRPAAEIKNVEDQGRRRVYAWSGVGWAEEARRAKPATSRRGVAHLWRCIRRANAFLLADRLRGYFLSRLIKLLLPIFNNRDSQYC